MKNNNKFFKFFKHLPAKEAENNKMKLKIRDFIYLDIERLKSIIAQIEEGLVIDTSTSLTSGKDYQASIKAGMKVFYEAGIDAKFLWQNQASETKTLHDNIYNKVESILKKEKILKEFDEESGFEDETENIRNSLIDTSYVLIKGRVVINDYDRALTILNKFNDIGKFLSSIQNKTSPRNDPKSLQVDPNLVKGFQTIFETFYKNRVIVKIKPKQSGLTFSGFLKNSFFRDDITEIIYKYGTAPISQWNIFAQISSIPAQEEYLGSNVQNSSIIDNAFNDLFDKMRGVEQVIQTIAYPEIAITPIAIYRECN